MSLPQEQDRTKALLELLYHVSREVATALDLRTVLQRVLYETMQNVGGERCSIVVLDEAGEVIDGASAYNGKVEEIDCEHFSGKISPPNGKISVLGFLYI